MIRSKEGFFGREKGAYSEPRLIATLKPILSFLVIRKPQMRTHGKAARMKSTQTEYTVDKKNVSHPDEYRETVWEGFVSRSMDTDRQ